MNEILDIIVSSNRYEIIRQLFPLNETYLERNESNVSVQNQSNIFDRIVVFSDFCQTIVFLRELNSSLNYRLKVFKTFSQNISKRSRSHERDLTLNDQQMIDNSIDPKDSQIIRIMVRLKTMDHYLAIDSNWNRRILRLVVIRFQMEDSLAWLSTLGGAYSSLGEYNINCAVKAGQISISQLHLAVLTGDPNLVARCGIYMAYSLCQQQKRGEAIKIIRRTLYPFIIKIKNCDKIVISMYSALCYRIKNFDNNFNKISDH